MRFRRVDGRKISDGQMNFLDRSIVEYFDVKGYGNFRRVDELTVSFLPRWHPGQMDDWTQEGRRRNSEQLYDFIEHIPLSNTSLEPGYKRVDANEPASISQQ